MAQLHDKAVTVNISHTTALLSLWLWRSLTLVAARGGLMG